MTGGGPDEEDDEGEPWVKVVKGSKLSKKSAPYYIALSMQKIEGKWVGAWTTCQSTTC